MRRYSFRPGLGLFVMSLAVLSGCQTLQDTRDMYSGGKQVKSSEDLLAAEGDLSIVEDKREASPIEQHMKARGDVDPNKIYKKNKFTKNVKNSHAKDKTHYRVVRVEGEVEPDKTQTQTYIESILERHKERQADEPNMIYADAPRTAGKKKTKAVMAPAFGVTGLRIGQHPSKTRIVLDVSKKPQFHASFENGNRTMVLSLPKAVWETVSEKTVEGKDLISSYRASSTAHGVELKVSLNKPSQLVYQKAMGPSGAYGDRIVLDLVAR